MFELYLFLLGEGRLTNPLVNNWSPIDNLLPVNFFCKNIQ